MSESNSSNHGVPLNGDTIPPVSGPAKLGDLPSLDPSRNPHTSSLPIPSRPTFAESVKFNLGCNNHSVRPSIKLSTIHNNIGASSFQPNNSPTAPISEIDPEELEDLSKLLEEVKAEEYKEFRNLSLLAKPWGSSIPLNAIIAKTKLDWVHVKGEVKITEIGSGWLIIRFEKEGDRDYVWYNRPWFVRGTNLVLKEWEPFFDPYKESIEVIDQWIRISCLPLEFWSERAIRRLMKPVGEITKIDTKTLSFEKGRFVRVCVRLNIRKPLRGYILFPTDDGLSQISLSYENLYEVCAICGESDHYIEACPRNQSTPNVEILVDKLKSQAFSEDFVNEVAEKEEGKWTTVAPKKRFRGVKGHGIPRPQVGGIVIRENKGQDHENRKKEVIVGKGKGKQIVRRDEDDTSDDEKTVTEFLEEIDKELKMKATEKEDELKEKNEQLEGYFDANENMSKEMSISSINTEKLGELGENEASNFDPDVFLDLDNMDEPALSSDSAKKRKLT